MSEHFSIPNKDGPSGVFGVYGPHHTGRAGLPLRDMALFFPPAICES